MHPDEYLTTAEVARLKGVSVATVNRWAADGKLPAHQLPGKTGARLFRREDVEDVSTDTARAS